MNVSNMTILHVNCGRYLSSRCCGGAYNELEAYIIINFYILSGKNRLYDGNDGIK